MREICSNKTSIAPHFLDIVCLYSKQLTVKRSFDTSAFNTISDCSVLRPTFITCFLPGVTWILNCLGCTRNLSLTSSSDTTGKDGVWARLEKTLFAKVSLLGADILFAVVLLDKGKVEPCSVAFGWRRFGILCVFLFPLMPLCVQASIRSKILI